jgi:hypothetical protein
MIFISFMTAYRRGCTHTLHYYRLSMEEEDLPKMYSCPTWPNTSRLSPWLHLHHRRRGRRTHHGQHAEQHQAIVRG